MYEYKAFRIFAEDDLDSVLRSRILAMQTEYNWPRKLDHVLR